MQGIGFDLGQLAKSAKQAEASLGKDVGETEVMITGKSTRSKNTPNRMRSPVAEITDPIELGEIIGEKPYQEARTFTEEGGLRVEDTKGMTMRREKASFQDAVKNGAQFVNKTEVTIKTPHGLYKKQLPNRDDDLKFLVADVRSSAIGAYDMVVRAMKARGYLIQLSPDGTMGSSGHTIFKAQRPIPQPGITYPDDFRTLTPIPSNQLPLFSGVLADVIMGMLETVATAHRANNNNQGDGEARNGNLIIRDTRTKFDMDIEYGSSRGAKEGEDDGDDKKYQKQAYRAFMEVWAKFETFNKLALQCGTAMAGDKPHYKNPINVDGGKEAATRFVPQLDWFDSRLHNIDNEQLLSLLPAKEREAMMLFLGRAMLGREGTPHTNGYTQNLKFRSVLVMVGNQAGMGRTTLLEYLSEAMGICGYRAQPLESLVGRFGHGKTATNDLGFIDDLTPNETINAIGSSLLKTVSSGGTLMVENKGQPAYSVTAQGVYMLCTNQLDLPKLSQLDSGNLSRLMPLRNACSNDERAREYRAKYGYELNTDQTYEALSEEYQVPISTLVLLLLARSAEMFRGFMDKGQRELISKLQELKGSFQINTDMDYMDQLFQNFANVGSLLEKRPTVPGRFDIDGYLKNIIKAGGIDIPGCSDSKDLILDYARAAFGVRKKGVAAMAKEFMSVLTSEHGLGYIADYATLMQMYKQRVPQLNVEVISSMRLAVATDAPMTSEEQYWSDLEDSIRAVK